MMATIKVKNQRQNLFSVFSLRNQPVGTYGRNWDCFDNFSIIDDFSFSFSALFGRRAYLPLKAGTYTIYFEIEGAISLMTYIGTSGGNLGNFKYQTAKLSFTKALNFDLWFYAAAVSGDSPNRFGTLRNIVLLEGDYSNKDDAFFKELVKLSYIEFDNELFGYGGYYDQLFSNGKILKYWYKETGISITSGAGTVSQSGTGTCILIDETTELPYTGTMSETSISTSAPDGTYTVIYRLSTPIVETLDYDGELTLYPGTNYIILPDHAVASISGTRKYLEG